jgi:hypothetical protein
MAKPKDDIITGEQIEKILDLTQEAGVFDMFFGHIEYLTDDEWKTRTNMFNRMEKLGKDFEMDDRELAIHVKLNKEAGIAQRTLSKELIKKENRQIVKEIYAILSPDTEWDIVKAVNEIARRIPQIKSEIGLGF